MKSGQVFRAMPAIVVLAFGVISAFGQAVNNASMHGLVTDPSGSVVVGAQVNAMQTSTGLVRGTVSGADGSYILPNLPVGPYQLEVRMAGFQVYTQKGIVLQVGESPQINVSLHIGDVAQSVEVTADAIMVETRQTAVSEVIDQRRIVELPLNGREATQLVILSGAATNPVLVNNDLLSSKNYANGQISSSVTISVAGGQENATNYLLDGGDNNDTFSNVNLPFPFPDAIQEFSVQTSTSEARIGVHSGAVVNIVTKSGTNQFHGDAFEFLRNGAVNARHFFADPTKPDDTLKRNQFGGTLGGPIRKDRMMFFAGFQGTRNRQAPPTSSVHVPTAAALAGDFSALESYKTAANPAGCVPAPSKLPAGVTKKQLNTAFFDASDHLKSGVTMDPSALKLLSYVPVSTD